MEDIKAALAPLLAAQLQPIHSELRSQAEMLQKVLEEVANLHVAVAQLEKAPAFDGNQSFTDMRAVRKSLPVRPASGDMKAKAEEAKVKKNEAAAKAKEVRELEAKRKAEELQKKEEERAAKDKARKEAEAKRQEAKKEQDEEAKHKREETRPKGRTASGLKLESAKAEEAKAKLAAQKTKRKSVGSEETPIEREVRVSPLLAANEEPAVPVDPLPEAQPSPPAVQLLDPLPPLSELGSHPACASIDAELKALYQSYGEQTLRTPTTFALSVSAKSALSLLNTIDDSHLYLSSDPVRDEVYWVFRLFFQLCGQALSDVKAEAWATCRAYLAAGKASDLEQHVLQTCQHFDFSNENADKVDTLLRDKLDRINPGAYDTFCQLSSLLMFAVKEALVYAGCIAERAQPWRKCQRLLHRRKALL
jgi:flagellar biosynthesis GTPase FlhF